MEHRNLNRSLSFGVPDVALERVMAFIDEPRDRYAVSLVCRSWYNVDSITRKQVTIALCYSISPTRLRLRFPRLESLKLKGKPRASMFDNLIPEDWGGYAGPWIHEIANAFDCLTSLHLRRMIVMDEDIGVLVRARGEVLRSLKLDKCSGFSTNGLLMVARSCFRCLRTLFLEESSIDENDSDWLHELAVNNTVLETLNFYLTDLSVPWQDLELLARNCRSLISLKISDCDISALVGFFHAAKSLEEFTGSFDRKPGEMENYKCIQFPPRLCRLGLTYMGSNDMQIVFPLAAALKKLDLQLAFLSTEDHCQLIQQCPNLEILEVRNVIGDRGLEVVARTCKRLRRLRVERGEDEQGLEDEQGMVSHRGLSAIAQGCLELEYLAVYVFDITNAALECIGTFSKKLNDFRLVLLDREERITELPLDNGVLALLRGCPKLRRFALYLRHGGLTDEGLGHIGENSRNICYMLLGFVGQSDVGLLRFSRGCPDLRKLELRGCCFSERALAIAVTQMVSLKYIWVQGYNASPTGHDLRAMARPFWNIEFIPPRQVTQENDGDGEPAELVFEHPAQMLAYYSLAGPRTDCPNSVIPLYPPAGV